MSDVKLFFLGSPRIEHGGRPVEVDTRKAVALLAYLALTPGHHGRDTLAGLLWPEYGQSKARAALRRTLSSLKEARDAGWLEVERETICLNHAATWIDVSYFRDLLAGRRTHGHSEDEVCPECILLLESAAEVYRGDFLSGFGLRDSFEFDDWQYLQAEALRRELAEVLERLSRAHGANGEWQAAITHARRWLSLDPLHEPAHRRLIRLYALSGRRADALRQYRECVRILGGELGVSPLEETTSEYEHIKSGGYPQPFVFAEVRTRLPEHPSITHEAEHTGARVERLVGREAEREALLQAYDASGESGHVVVLEGEAGIGKTALAEDLIDQASGLGATVVSARCYPGEANLAYGPFVEGISACIARENIPERLNELPERFLSEGARLVPALAGLLPELPDLPLLDEPGARSRFFEGVVQTLLALCGGPHPGVLFVDDVHWADTSSLDLLAYLIRRLESSDRPLCVLLAWRGEELDDTHRLRGLLSEARRAHTVTHLSLPRLGREAVEELAGTVTDNGGVEELARRLYEETEGLPLFVAEYLAEIESGGSENSQEWSLPGGVRDLLAGRLRALGETGRQIISAAAVIGRSFDFDTVREASGRGEEEAITAIEELLSHALIREVADGGENSPVYDFSHDKLRALVYEETSFVRRRLLHRRVAASLAARDTRRETGALAGQISYHYRLSGDDSEAARYSRLAGDHARALYANADALAHFQQALALGHPDPASLHEAIGDLQTLAGDYVAALSSYESAAALREGESLAAIERKLGNLHARQGEHDLAEGHYTAALAALGGEEIRDDALAGMRARLYADRSLLAHRRGRSEAAMELAREALEQSERAGDAHALAQTQNVLGILASGEGDAPAAYRHLERSLELSCQLENPDARVAALNNLALARGEAGEVEAATELFEEALSLCVSLGDRHHEAALRNNLADLLHAAGREEDSMDHLKRAVAIFAEIGEEGTLQPEIWKLAEW